MDRQTDRQTLTLDGKVDGPVTDGSNKSISFRFSIVVPLFHPPTLVILYFGTNNSKKKMSTYLRTILSVKCLQDKYVRIFYVHVCLLVLLIFCLYKKRTLSLLFLSNISYPSPTKNFYFEKGKNIRILLGSNPILLCSH